MIGGGGGVQCCRRSNDPSCVLPIPGLFSKRISSSSVCKPQKEKRSPSLSRCQDGAGFRARHAAGCRPSPRIHREERHGGSDTPEIQRKNEAVLQSCNSKDREVLFSTFYCPVAVKFVWKSVRATIKNNQYKIYSNTVVKE